MELPRYDAAYRTKELLGDIRNPSHHSSHQIKHSHRFMPAAHAHLSSSFEPSPSLLFSHILHLLRSDVNTLLRNIDSTRQQLASLLYRTLWPTP